MISRTSPDWTMMPAPGRSPAAASARLTAAVASSDGIGVVPGDGFRSERIRMRQFSCTAATGVGRQALQRRSSMRPSPPAGNSSGSTFARKSAEPMWRSRMTSSSVRTGRCSFTSRA